MLSGSCQRAQCIGLLFSYLVDKINITVGIRLLVTSGTMIWGFGMGAVWMSPYDAV